MSIDKYKKQPSVSRQVKEWTKDVDPLFRSQLLYEMSLSPNSSKKKYLLPFFLDSLPFPQDYLTKCQCDGKRILLLQEEEEEKEERRFDVIFPNEFESYYVIETKQGNWKRHSYYHPPRTYPGMSIWFYKDKEVGDILYMGDCHAFSYPRLLSDIEIEETYQDDFIQSVSVVQKGQKVIELFFRDRHKTDDFNLIRFEQRFYSNGREIGSQSHRYQESFRPQWYLERIRIEALQPFLRTNECLSDQLFFFQRPKHHLLTKVVDNRGIPGAWSCFSYPNRTVSFFFSPSTLIQSKKGKKGEKDQMNRVELVFKNYSNANEKNVFIVKTKKENRIEWSLSECYEECWWGWKRFTP